MSFVLPFLQYTLTVCSEWKVKGTMTADFPESLKLPIDFERLKTFPLISKVCPHVPDPRPQ